MAMAVYQQVDLWRVATQEHGVSDDPFASEIAVLQEALQELDSLCLAGQRLFDDARQQLEAHNRQVSDAGEMFYRAPYDSGRQQPVWLAWDEVYRVTYRDEADHLEATLRDAYHRYVEVYGQWHRCNERLMALSQEQRFAYTMRRNVVAD